MYECTVEPKKKDGSKAKEDQNQPLNLARHYQHPHNLRSSRSRHASVANVSAGYGLKTRIGTYARVVTSLDFRSATLVVLVVLDALSLVVASLDLGGATLVVLDPLALMVAGLELVGLVLQVVLVTLDGALVVLDAFPLVVTGLDLRRAALVVLHPLPLVVASLKLVRLILILIISRALVVLDTLPFMVTRLDLRGASLVVLDALLRYGSVIIPARDGNVNLRPCDAWPRYRGRLR